MQAFSIAKAAGIGCFCDPCRGNHNSYIVLFSLYLIFSLCCFIFLLCLYIMPFDRPPLHNIPSSN